MPAVSFKSFSIVHDGAFIGSMMLRFTDDAGLRQGIIVTQHSLELALSLHLGKVRIPLSGPDQQYCDRLSHDADPKAARVRLTCMVDRKDVEKVILLRQVSQLRLMLEDFDKPAVSFQDAKSGLASMLDTFKSISVGAAEIAVDPADAYA